MRYLSLIFALVLPQFVTAQESAFATVQLPRGIQISIPKGWLLVGAEIKPPIRTSVESAMDLSDVALPEGNDINIIGAKSMPETTYAAIRVDSTVPTRRAPDEIIKMTSIEMKKLQRDANERIKKALPTQGSQLLAFLFMRKDRISSHPAIVTEYRRSGLSGPVMVEVNQIFTPFQEVRLVLSYRESEKDQWRPILLHVRKSIQIDNWP